MIAFLDGILAEKTPSRVTLDVHGVGYELLVSLSTYDRLPHTGETCRLLVHHHVREDAQTLFGFAQAEEKRMFERLTGVNGVGPKVALGILSAGTADSFRLAVHQKDIKGLTKMPGIGKKTAERIVLELQDKIGPVASEDAGAADLGGSAAPGLSGILAETLAALTSLGYSEQEVLPVAESHLAGCTTVEQLLKETLKALGSGR